MEEKGVLITLRRYKEYLYSIAIVLMLISEIFFSRSTLKIVLGKTFVNNVENILWGLIIFILVMCILVGSKYTLKAMISYLVIILICVSASMVSGHAAIIKFALFFVGAKDIRFNHLFKVYGVTFTFLNFCIVLGYLIGLLPNAIYAKRFGVERNTLGFTTPAIVSFFGYNTLFYYLYNLERKKKKAILRPILFASVLMGILWFVANSRTGVIVIFILLILFLGLKTKKNLYSHKWFAKIPIMCAGVSLYFMIFYNGSIHGKINYLLSMRPYLANQYYNITGIHLFGSNAYNLSLPVVSLDNSYCALLLRYGLIVFSFILMLYFNAAKKAINNKQYMILIGIIGISIFGISELTIYSLFNNIVLLWIITQAHRKSNKRI